MVAAITVSAAAVENAYMQESSLTVTVRHCVVRAVFFTQARSKLTLSAGSMFDTSETQKTIAHQRCAAAIPEYLLLDLRLAKQLYANTARHLCASVPTFSAMHRCSRWTTRLSWSSFGEA